MILPYVTPMPLQRRPEPFDDPDWLFELTYDGFRGVAYKNASTCKLVSRNGHHFGSWPDLAADIGAGLGVESAVLDGEIVCLADQGRPLFNDLLFRRGIAYFYAFDLLHDGKVDRRFDRLIDRKQDLKRMIRQSSASRLLYADHIEGNGTALFERACDMDLESIVAKYKYGRTSASASTAPGRRSATRIAANGRAGTNPLNATGTVNRSQAGTLASLCASKRASSTASLYHARR